MTGAPSGFLNDWLVAMVVLRDFCVTGALLGICVTGAPSGLCLTGGPGFVCDWCNTY
jgi:hypothetical protein